ncbi:MAG: hypothetical protein H6595_07875 [Flavobacteriales bacterium]|nr:hypothetical protein [Flavobacteriales bacterium]MCB9167384.1 hypothetical protein [Flavobacteriales bacterium]
MWHASPLTFPPRILALWLGLSFMMAACASGPKGVTRHKRGQKCDCPHWNRVPAHRQDGEIRSDRSGPGSEQPFRRSFILPTGRS